MFRNRKSVAGGGRINHNGSLVSVYHFNMSRHYLRVYYNQND